MKKTIYGIALALAVASCNNTRPVSEQATDEQSAEPTATLYDTHWELTELEGTTISVDSTFNKTPFIMFTEQDSRVQGNAGCNGFGGLLEVEGQEGIKISEIAATQMACPNLELEQRFIEALRNANSYTITGDTLLLGSAQTNPLAKLVKTA